MNILFNLKVTNTKKWLNWTKVQSCELNKHVTWSKTYHIKLKELQIYMLIIYKYRPKEEGCRRPPYTQH